MVLYMLIMTTHYVKHWVSTLLYTKGTAQCISCWRVMRSNLMECFMYVFLRRKEINYY